METKDLFNKTFEIISGAVDPDRKNALLQTRGETGAAVVICLKRPTHELLASLEKSRFKGFISGIIGKAGTSEKTGNTVIIPTFCQHTLQKPERPFYKDSAHQPHSHEKPHC